MSARPSQRPAETGGFGLAAVVAAALILFGIDLSQAQMQALLVLLGAVPAAITVVVVFYRKVRSG